MLANMKMGNMNMGNKLCQYEALNKQGMQPNTELDKQATLHKLEQVCIEVALCKTPEHLTIGENGRQSQ